MSITLFPYQRDDLAKLGCRSKALLGYQQSLGKTLTSLIWTKLRNAKRCLVIAPQDLWDQWRAEADKLGIEMTKVDSYAQAIRLWRARPRGYYFTHFEFLKGMPTKQEPSPDWRPGPAWEQLGRGPYKKDALQEFYRRSRVCRRCRGRLTTDLRQCADCGEPNTFEAERDERTDEELPFISYCPECRAVEGWSGQVCAHCGYHRYEARPTPVYQLLKNIFDTILVDEGVKMKNVNSLQGRAVHALRARNKMVLSGSPIKSTLPDLFYLLHWCYGEGSAVFPYRFEGGLDKFLEDFCVYEQEKKKYNKGNTSGKRFLPEITNISMLWRLLSPAILRRTKPEAYGMEFVDMSTRYVDLPMSQEQRAVYDWWETEFVEWYKQTHAYSGDDHTLELRQKIMGQLAKLKTASSLPSSDKLEGRDLEDGFHVGKRLDDGLTPKTAWLIEKLAEVRDRGEQSLVLTSLQDYAEHLRKELDRIGLKALVLNGTVSPKKRGALVRAFKRGEYDLLIAGIEAMNLGHNIENARYAFMTDYIWEHSTTRQAVERIHRTHSKDDVEVYYLYHRDSIEEYHIDLIRRKGNASDLAIDGALQDNEEERLSVFDVAKQITAGRVRRQADGEEMPQAELRERVNALRPQAAQNGNGNGNGHANSHFKKPAATTVGEQLSLFGS